MISQCASKLRVFGSASLSQPVQVQKLFPSSRESDHHPLSPSSCGPDRYPNLRPLSFSKPSCCPLGDRSSGPSHPSAPIAFNYHPSHLSLRPPFSKPVPNPSFPPSSSRREYKPAQREALTPPSSSKRHGYLHISSVSSPPLSSSHAPSFSKPSSKVSTPSPNSSCNNTTDMQKDILVVSC